MDAFKLLMQDHKEVRQLFKKIEDSGEGAIKTRQNTFKELARALAVHTKLEERIVYPRLSQMDELKETVNEGIEEHHVADTLLEEIAKMKPDDEQWIAKVTVLKEVVEHHVQEEEKELFPRATKLLEEDELSDMGETLADEKKEMLRGADPATKEVFQRLGL